MSESVNPYMQAGAELKETQPQSPAAAIMTPRENVIATYRHQAHDATPVLLESIALVGEFAANEMGKSGKEVRPGITLDCFGCEWDHQHGQPMNARDYMLFDDIAEWRDKVVFPKPREYDWDALAKEEIARANFDRSKQAMAFFDLIGVFDRLTAFMGFENCLLALCEDPEECDAFFEAVTDYKLELMECAYEALHPDIWTYHLDVAAATSLMMSPETFRTYIKPHVARLVDAVHSYGMIAEIHTCGKFESLVEDYIEIGVDSVMPAQSINDLAGILEKHGDSLIVNGGWDSQGPAALADAPEEVIREEARRVANDYATRGSFIFMPYIGGIGAAPTPEEITRTLWAIDEFHKECAKLGI